MTIYVKYIKQCNTNQSNQYKIKLINYYNNKVIQYKTN